MIRQIILIIALAAAVSYCIPGLLAFDPQLRIDRSDSVRLELIRAQSLVSQGKYGEASMICIRTMENDPGNKEAVRIWLTANRGNGPGSPDGDVRLLRDLETRYPDNSAVIFWKSMILAENGHPEEALKGFEVLTNIQPDSAVNWIAKGQIMDALGRFNEAYMALDKGVKLDPRRSDVWGMRGVALARLSRYNEAIESLTKALDMSPGNPVDLYNRACVYCLKGDKTRSMEDLKRAITASPEFRQMAANDNDFRKLWNDPDFINLTK